MASMTFRTFLLTTVCLLPDDVRKGFEVHFADTFEDVYSVALDYDANAV